MSKKLRILTLILISSLLLGLAVAFSASASAATKISEVAVTGIDLPVRGARPDTTASVDNAGARVDSIDWYDETSGKYLENNDTFVEGHRYTAQIWVEAKSNYEFACANDNTPTVKATVFGVEAKVTKAYEYKAWAMVVANFTFPEVPKVAWVRTVDVSVTTPEAGQPLSYAKCTRNGYDTHNIFGESNASYNAVTKNGISWQIKNPSSQDLYHADNPKAVAGYSYKVVLDMVAQYGYAFAPDAVYKVNGNPADGNLNYGGGVARVSYVFPPTKSTIYRIDLEIPAPKADELPQYPVLSGTGYIHTDASSDTTVNGITYIANGNKLSKFGTFAADTKYTVAIELKVLEHYQLHPQCNLYVNGTPATAVGPEDDGIFTVLADFTTGASPVHNHTPSGWISDGRDHYRVCTDPNCRQEIPGTRSAHTGGTATCMAKAKCALCGVIYGEYAPHAWSADWNFSDKTGHAHTCTTPGCSARDTVVPHAEGPTGTPDTAAVCGGCGYIIRPAANHTHSLKKVAERAPTCIEPGTKEYYACSGCSELFKDDKASASYASADELTLAPKGHSLSEWASDGDFHWRTCTVCNELLDETKLHHGDGDGDGKCDTCAYVAAEGTLPPVLSGDSTDGTSGDSTDGTSGNPSGDLPGDASDSDESRGSDGEKGGNGASALLFILLPVAGGALILIAAAIVVVILLKKKKAKESDAPAEEAPESEK